MSNLLYVTNNIIQKLKQHKAYYFWLPLIQNLPIRNIPLEERSFHPRNVEITNGCIYLTVDMKFVYARDNVFSFLYENQDLSYRFTAYQGIVRTLDNKQFTALIGKIANVVASTDVELVNTDKVYHPLFDAGVLAVGAPLEGVALESPEIEEKPLSSKQTKFDAESGPRKKRGRPRKNPLPETCVVQEPNSDIKSKRGRPKKISDLPNLKEKPPDAEELILGMYSKNLCDEIYTFRIKMKKNYDFLSQKYELDKKDLRRICKFYRNQEKQVE